MSNHFTHLHLHSEFSLLDGAIRLDKLIKQAKEQELKSLAITDHGNIFGAVKFFDLCKKNGIKPILGMEAYFTEDVSIKSVEKKYYHLIILVENAIGYKNLCKLISFSYQDGFYFKPRIDYKRLEQYKEGLIVTSACLGGHIPQLLKGNEESEAHNRIDWFVQQFGKDKFYFEVQPEEQDEQKVLNKRLFDLSEKYGIQTVATTDCHYLTLDDHEAHEIMLSLQTGKQFDDPTRFTFGQCRAYMRSKDEMLDVFKDHPQAVWNTGKVADMCNFDFEKGKLFFPKFAIPDNKTEAQFFEELCSSGLETLFQQKRIPLEEKQIYQDRLKLEVDLIISMGFIGYFLIVGDFIRWAKRNNIPVGPGRGSAAGSLVAWALEITNIDPLKYNLLFERFLNPERITMPDIDIDFCIEGREHVINYIKDTYGHDKVCQIITFGTLMAKGVIKDVARVLGFSFEDSNMITNLIPEQLKITLAEALEQEPQLQSMIESNPKIKHLFDIAFKLEGLTRHASKHAAGVVVTPEPIDDMLPVYIPPKTTELVSQYAMTELESIGFLKIDLLGLKNLTLIKKAIELIKQQHNVSIDIDFIPLDDAKTFALLQRGATSGVFQLESNGLKEVLRKLKPEKFEDIIAVNALYRPGPLGSGMVDDFILRKQGKQKITYIFPELEPILAETYGVIVYQEQVMKIASAIGGYSLGEADILRRAMGKKKAEVMAEQKEIFCSKAGARSFDTKKASELFDLIVYFAGYGFNKSHSAAYALIAYQTAYLKANYPAEFAASLISLEATNAENMAFYLKEAKDMGLEILPPDVNTSEIDFTVVQGKLLFGLQGIKNVGLAALEDILKERAKKPFTHILDFCTRIDLRTSNKRVLENLACAGALDCFPGSRAQKYTDIEHIIATATTIKKEKATGQMSLFGASRPQDYEETFTFTTQTNWSEKEKLEKEKEVLGFYISSHPLDSYKKQYSCLGTRTLSQALQLLQNNPPTQEIPFTTCLMLETKKEIMTKKGDKMAFATCTDQEHSAEVILFPKTYAQCAKWLSDYHVFIIQGTLDPLSTQTCKIKANSFIPLDLFFEYTKIQEARLQLPQNIDPTILEKLTKELPQGNVPISFVFTENNKKILYKTKHKTSVNFAVLEKIMNSQIIPTLLF
jgi:DNA polymerase-3 subunit alpha